MERAVLEIFDQSLHYKSLPTLIFQKKKYKPLLSWLCCLLVISLEMICKKCLYSRVPFLSGVLAVMNKTDKWNLQARTEEFKNYQA